MPEDRKFARFRPAADRDRMVFQVPTDGLCLSTFLVLRPTGHPEQALLGHLDPRADWKHLGAVDAGRAERWAKEWMLPSSQILYYETPEASARRIAQEQLGVELTTLPAPALMSDSEQRPNAGKGDLHWDIGFVYLLDGRPVAPPRHAAWTELKFLEISKIPRSELARSQADVLALVGVSSAA